jgi:hypothetical protein
VHLLQYCRVIDGFFSQIGGLNPASPVEMAALRSKLSDSRRAVLAEQWELFTQSSLYLDAFRGAEAEAQARAAPLRAFDRPYSGGVDGSGGGGAAGTGKAPIGTRDDTYQSSKKGQYAGQYIEPYKGASQSYGQGQGQGQRQGQGQGEGQGQGYGYGKQVNTSYLASHNLQNQDILTVSLPLAQPASHTQVATSNRLQTLPHMNSHPYQQSPMAVQVYGHATGQ